MNKHTGMPQLVKLTLLLWAIASTLSLSAQERYSAWQANYKTGLHKDLHIDTSLVTFYPFNEQMAVNAAVELLHDQPVFEMITSSGKTKKAIRFARLTFELNSHPYALYAYQLLALKESAEHAQHFFVPFKDGGSGTENYGGGRYLDFTEADIQHNQLLIDFNKAYNPYCAFATGYNCPIPPAANRLPFPVNAGEKKFGRPH